MTVPLLALVSLAIPVAWILIWLPERVRIKTSAFEFAVKCSPEKAFDFVSDRRNEPLYQPEVEVSQLLTDLPIGSGSRFHQRVRLPEILIEVDEIITAFNRPEAFGIQMATRRKYRGKFTFIAQGTGTLVRYDTFQVHPLFEAWAGLIWHPAQKDVADRIDRQRHAWSGRLKEILEA
jgi:hypothetical protein